ncbi:MAG: YkvA family protein [Solirubrobacterales bacterium]
MLASVLLALAFAALLWASAIALLLLVGRRDTARALAAFLPDSLILVRRLLADPSVPRSRKLALWALLAYLALPFDLVPDFLPAIGQLDDAVIAALVLRFVLRGAGPARLAELWPGSPQGLAVISRLAFGAQASAALASRSA